MKITKWISIFTVLVLLMSLMAVGVSAEPSKIRADLLERLEMIGDDEPVSVYVDLIDPPKLNEVSIPALIAEKYGITTINADTIDDYYMYERIELTAIYQPFFEEFFEDYKDGIVEKLFVPSHSDFCLLKVYKSTIYEMANDDRVNEIAYFENSILEDEEIDDGVESRMWYETSDGQFLYRPYKYGQKACIQVVYIGDGDDVTVPATFGGQSADVIWFTNMVDEEEPIAAWVLTDVSDVSEVSEVSEASEPAEELTLRDRVRAAAKRYLNLTFEEGPTSIAVRPVMWPDYLRVASVTLPKSATATTLYTVGLTALSVPEGSALTDFSLYNVMYGVENPQPTVIDMTGAVRLYRVSIARDEYMEDCFMEGSLLKLPTEFKDVPILREQPSIRYENPYLFIDVDPMPLTVQYADGSERAIPSQNFAADGWHVTEDGQFLYQYMKLYELDCVQVVYIGDDTDVTVPAAYDGKFPYMVWLANDVDEFDWETNDPVSDYRGKIKAAAERYLNFTFEDGPINVWVMPNLRPSYVRANSVKLPTSVVRAMIKTEGATNISVPQISFLHDILIENVLEGASNPQPTTIDLSGSAYLERVWISREDYGGDCFVDGSVIKLPTAYKKIPVQRHPPVRWNDPPYFFIDIEPMPLTIEYADGSERPATYPGDVTDDDSVDMKDVLLLRQFIANLVFVEPGDGVFALAADFNHDGEINMKDVLCIRKISAGLSV